jgi:hypothetical protein
MSTLRCEVPTIAHFQFLHHCHNSTLPHSMSFTVRTRTANSRTSQQQQDTRQDTKQGTKQKKEKSSKPSKPKTSSSTQSTPTTNWSTMHHGRRVGSLSTGPSDRPANPMLEAAERRRQGKQQQDSNASNSVSS